GGAGGGMMPSMAGGQGGAAAMAQRNSVKELSTMDLDKLRDDNSAHLAEELLPGRMVLVAGSFPYKKQLEAFRVALRMRSLNDLVNNLNREDVTWKFLAPEIERRVLLPDGRVKTDWQPHYEQTMLNALTALLAIAVDTEKDDADLTKFFGVRNA